MTTMGRDDPSMQMLWSPMTRDGLARYTTLRAAIQRTCTPPPPTTAQTLRAKYAAGARRSSDAMFFETFGSPEQLMRMDDDDELCAELFHRPTIHEPEPEPESVRSTAAFASHPEPPRGHVSQLAKPTRLPTPKRISLKRARTGESSAEKAPPARKPRLSLVDTTNRMHTSTTTTTMTNPWDKHYHNNQIRKPLTTKNQPYEPTMPATTVTSAFSSARTAPSLLPRPSTHDMPSITSTRAYALR